MRNVDRLLTKISAEIVQLEAGRGQIYYSKKVNREMSREIKVNPLAHKWGRSRCYCV